MQIKEKIISLIVSILGVLPAKVNKNRILFLSNPSFSDNSYYVYKFFETKSDKYELWWQIAKKDSFRPNCRYVIKGGNLFEKIKYWYIFKTSHFIVTTHIYLPVRKGQMLITLWHGEPFKKWDAKRKLILNSELNTFVTSNEFTENIRRKVYGLDKVVYLHCPQARLSALLDFKRYSEIRKLINLNGGSIVVMMPTYLNGKPNESFARLDLKAIDRKCKELKVIFFIKLHPHYTLTSKYTDLQNQLENIKFIDSRWFEGKQLNLYDLLNVSDALITDFSSVFIDFLYTNRPISFFLDESLESYITENCVLNDPISKLPGPILRTTNDVLTFLNKLSDKNDAFLPKRQSFFNLYRANSDGSFSDGAKMIYDYIERNNN